MRSENKKIIPPEQRIPSRNYRIKIKETTRKRDVKLENFFPLEIEDFDKVKYRSYDTREETKEELPRVKFVIDKFYLQRLVDDPTKLLLTAYIDYGYLKSNRVEELVEIDKKRTFMSRPKGSCKIMLFNDNFCEIAEIPMKHSSEFTYHPIASAPQLFLGLIENLEERKEYFYRIECFDENNDLIGASRIKNITSSVQSPTKPFFFVSASDLHGGYQAKFKRGKVWRLKPKKNPKLRNFMAKINMFEPEFTFGYEYQVFTTSGDNVENGSYQEYWADLFACSSVNFSRYPVLPTIGNHDYYQGGIGRGAFLGGSGRTQKHFQIFFQTPRKEGGAFYSHTEGNVFMIHLDSIGLNWGNESITCDSRQWKWLEKELREWRRKREEEEGPEFCVVFLHSAIFTIGFFGRARNNSDAIAQSCLTPLFDAYGVNAVLFGHDHMYQRSSFHDTSYMCIGLSGKVPINYFNGLRNKTGYMIHADEEGEKARGYGVTYVPPNISHMKIKEKKEFEEWLEQVKIEILKKDLCLFYTFEKGRKSDEYKELMSDKDKKKKFVEENIIDNMRKKIWWRFYNIKGELLDQVFLPKPEKLAEDIEDISCPAPHIR